MADTMMAEASSGERTSSSPAPSTERHDSVPTRSSSHAISALGFPPDHASKEDTPIALSAFERITQDLIKIGAIPLEKFATEDYPVEDTSALVKPAANANAEMLGGVKANFQAVAQIYEACMKQFGKSDGISWEFMSELGPNCKECILTITRPDNGIRAYTSGPYFKTKNDAKVAAASVAINMKVLDFIQHGDTDVKRGGYVAPMTAPGESRLKPEAGKEAFSIADEVETKIDDHNVRAIEDCIKEWRAGTIKPVYMHFSEPTIVSKPKGKGKKAQPVSEMELATLRQGCALKIEISQHAVRVFSVHHIYQSRADAKAAVAKLAILQGVIDFIKYANGQTEPMVWIPELHGDANENLNKDVITSQLGQPKMEVEIDTTAVKTTLKRYQIPLDVMTLQTFTKSLPKPLPETPGLRSVGDSNPIGWINTAVQLARGSRMGITWTYMSNAKTSLHGCLLRFNLPQDSDGRSYVVEPSFSKRGDAKTAVAYLAISQGVGPWIKSIKDQIDDLMTPDLTHKAQSLLPILNTECSRVGIKGQPTYNFEYEDGGVGCTMKVEFSPELSRSWTVPIQYKTKPDARSAVVLQAQADGVLEFIRFKGEEPPEGYEAEKPYDHRAARKQIEPRGKIKNENQDEQQKPFNRRREYDRQPRRSNSQYDNRRWQPQGHKYRESQDMHEQEDYEQSMEWEQMPEQENVQPFQQQPPPPNVLQPPPYPQFPPPAPMVYGVVPGQTPAPMPIPFNPYAQAVAAPFYNPTSIPPYTYPQTAFPPSHMHMPPVAPTAGLYPPPTIMNNEYQQVNQQHYQTAPQQQYHTPNDTRTDWDNRPPPNAPTGPKRRDRDDHQDKNKDSSIDPAVRALRPPVIPRRHRGDDSRRDGRRSRSPTRARSRSRSRSPSRHRRRSRSRSRERGRERKYKKRSDSRSRSYSRERRRKTRRASRSKSRSISPKAASRAKVEDKTEEKPAHIAPVAPPVVAIDKSSTSTSTVPNSTPAETKSSNKAATSAPNKSTNLKPAGFKYTIALDAHCAKNNLKRPIYKHEEVKPGEFKVWIVLDRERLELPITFKDIEVGKEKIAKQVLARAKGIAAKKKQENGGGTEKAKAVEEELEPGEVRD